MPNLDEILGLLNRVGAVDINRLPLAPNGPPPPIEGDLSANVTPRVGTSSLHVETITGTGEDGHASDDLSVDWIRLASGDWDLCAELDELISADEPVNTRVAWETAAWYQQIHYYGQNWGIFIDEKAVVRIANQVLLKYLAAGGPISATAKKSALAAAQAMLFTHEVFHHRMESASIRVSAIAERSTYPEYHRLVYKEARSLDEPLEEGLANAFMYREFGRRAPGLDGRMSKAAQKYMLASFKDSAPGYRLATDILGSFEYGRALRDLVGRILNRSPWHDSDSWHAEMALALTGALFADDRIPTFMWTAGAANPFTPPLRR
ncbi:hypothetical protein ET495_03455 [Xylanimonas allomyrinae]|uniref:Uncharacterized protein n=1 Tax=Xylanimonas allomyrinae TaxID=2509459 RepID=A0A4P6ELA4_9MICO|nr:hypothetical protein [Xylanimonas allomyrinae]QAY62463.1 hypothetical protein ET495_03455 [Xylanimonas allomyrinae]